MAYARGPVVPGPRRGIRPVRARGSHLNPLATQVPAPHLSRVTDLQFADEILERIRALPEPYDERGYLFVLAALEYEQQQRTVRGHVSGQELAWACRDFAVDQFGLTARSVLKYWGLESTADFGRIVFSLIDIGLFMKEESDQLDDFIAVFEFDEEFDRSYPWAGVKQVGR